MGIVINGGKECLVTLMNWDVLFYSHKKMRRLLNLKIKQFDYMLDWLLVSADTNTFIEKFCVHRCPKTFPCITEACHDKKRVALISDRKVHKTASRPVVSKINPAHTKHILLQGTDLVLYQFDLCVLSLTTCKNFTGQSLI
jgi:hypothetical protein